MEGSLLLFKQFLGKTFLAPMDMTEKIRLLPRNVLIV